MDRILYKYFGLDLDTKAARVSFFDDGLFRITQPCLLNDKFSEARLYPYVNEFSAADLAWARRQHEANSIGSLEAVTDELLINLHLRPLSVRQIEAFPHMLSMFEETRQFKSVEEFDNYEVERIVKGLNETLVNILSLQFGVFSLTTSDISPSMWGRYGAEGHGVVVGFDSSSPFFLKHKPEPVSYEPEARASVTYYKGTVRLFGYPVKYFQTLSERLGSIFQEPDLMHAMHRGLLFAKDPIWANENEKRILFPISTADQQTGPELNLDLPSELSGLPLLKELTRGNVKSVCLKRIPFESIASVTFGYDMERSTKARLQEKLLSDDKLKHIKQYETEFDIRGNLLRRELNT